MNLREMNNAIEAARNDPNAMGMWDFTYNSKLGPLVALAYSRIFWPEFVERDGWVFLFEHYCEEKFVELLDRVGADGIEETINTVYLDDLFMDDRSDLDEELFEELGAIMSEAWVAKAQLQFPDKTFISGFDWYDDGGAPGVWFCQKRYAGNRS